MRILEMKCTGCGSALEITPDMDQFTCAYCGMTQVVQRGGGTVVLKPLVDSITKVQIGTDRTAAELSLVRLNGELTQVRLALKNPAASIPPVHDSTETSTSEFHGWVKKVFFANVLLLIWIVIDRADSYSPKHPGLSVFSFAILVITTILIVKNVMSGAVEKQKQRAHHIATQTPRLLAEEQRIVHEIASVKAQLGASSV